MMMRRRRSRCWNARIVTKGLAIASGQVCLHRGDRISLSLCSDQTILVQRDRYFLTNYKFSHNLTIPSNAVLRTYFLAFKSSSVLNCRNACAIDWLQFVAGLILIGNRAHARVCNCNWQTLSGVLMLNKPPDVPRERAIWRNTCLLAYMKKKKKKALRLGKRQAFLLDSSKSIRALFLRIHSSSLLYATPCEQNLGVVGDSHLSQTPHSSSRHIVLKDAAGADHVDAVGSKTREPGYLHSQIGNRPSVQRHLQLASPCPRHSQPCLRTTGPRCNVVSHLRSSPPLSAPLSALQFLLSSSSTFSSVQARGGMVLKPLAQLIHEVAQLSCGRHFIYLS